MTAKIAFLLGSGVSIPAGLPSMHEITEKVISGVGITHCSDDSYCFGDASYYQMGFPDEYVPRIIIFLKRIKIEIDLYYHRLKYRPTNYEDLYYIAKQVHDSETFEYDNPIAKPFIDKIIPDLKVLFHSKKSEIKSKWTLSELADESTKYIHDIVWNMLSTPPARLDHLNIIKDFCIDEEISKVDIFTLNHDTLLEQLFSNEKIVLNDGFSAAKNKIRQFDSSFFKLDTDNTRLIKLHGSINWFRYRPDGGDWSNEFIGIPLNQDFWHVKDSNDTFLFPLDGRPKLLIGTYNKMLSYVGGIYSELHYQFYNILKEKNIIVVIGYGFGDRGINTKIIDWIYSDIKNKIIIIHPQLEKLKYQARGSISNKWDNWIKEKKLYTIEKYIEESTKEDIINLL